MSTVAISAPAVPHIKPMPKNQGVGFFTRKEDPILEVKYYDIKEDGDYRNYHFSPTNFVWPVPVQFPNKKLTIDGFSPNLNKDLHVGHLRNLVVAAALKNILGGNITWVAFLGGKLGIDEKAKENLKKWFKLADYSPKEYMDMTVPFGNVPSLEKQGTGEFANCFVVDMGHGPIVTSRTDGEKTYAFYDLAFHDLVKPDYYIVGSEQTYHFKRLGWSEKHLPLGLVLGKDGTKLKSRTEDAMMAAELLNEIGKYVLKEHDTEPGKLAWNSVVFSMLYHARHKTIKFDLEKFVSQNGGIYVTYTFARVAKALAEAGSEFSQPEPKDLEKDDLILLGVASYERYYTQRVIDTMDPVHLASYVMDLATLMNKFYERESIKDGRIGYKFAMKKAHIVLRRCMMYLGMKELLKI